MKNNIFLIAILILSINSKAQTSKEFLNKGNQYLIGGNFPAALSEFSKAIEIDSNIHLAYIRRAVTKEHLEDYEGAIKDYTKAINIDSNYNGLVDLYINRGDLQSLLKKFNEAKLDYDIAINLNKANLTAYAKRGMVKKNNGEFDKAINDFSKVINGNDTFMGIYALRGECKFNMEDYYGAIEDLTKAIKNDSGLDYYVSNSYLYRGISKIKIKEIKEGCLDLSKAGEMGKVEAYDYIKKYCK